MKRIPSVKSATAFSTNQADSGRHRRRFSKSLAAGLILLTSFILTANSPCRAQSGGDAMFIDQNGNVGLGKQVPRTKLDVNGTILGIGMVPPKPAKDTPAISFFTR